MIINRNGAKLHYKDSIYTVGGKIVSNDESEYEGLYGTILEIRDGDDKETDNDSPDIYCAFIPPVIPDEIKAIEERFSRLYRTEKHLDDIGFDMVIMAPEMIDILDPPANVQKTEIFLIREDWAYDGDCGTSTQVVADSKMARFIFNNLIFQEHLDGCIADWKGRADLEVDARTDCYECWLHDEYFENHYKIAIERAELSVPEQLFRQFGKGYIARSLKEDLVSQVEQWEEVSRLTEDQFLKFISNPNIPERIESHLSKNDSYWDSYWESISECAHSMLHDYLMQISKEDCFRPEPNNLYPLCEGDGTESCLKCCVYKDYSEGNGQD